MKSAPVVKKRPTSTPRAAKWIKLIHVAKRELAMDDESYRTVLRNVGGAESTKDMNMQQLTKVLDHMKHCGFKVRPSNQQKGRPIYNETEEARKVRALWLFLHTLGVIKDPSERALAAFIKRIVKVDDLRFVRDCTPLIESLKQWAMRFLPNIISEMIDELAQQELTAEQGEWAAAAVQRLGKGEGFDVHWQAWVYCMRALGRAIPQEVSPSNRKSNER